MKPKALGFTLLEVLIALSLLGLLMVLITSAMTAGLRSLDVSERYSSRITDIRTAQNFLRTALQQSLPIIFFRDSDNLDLVFEGERQHMRFVAPVPDRLAGGVQLHSLDVVGSDPAAASLQVSFTQFNTGTYRLWGNPQTLLTNLRDLQFSYRGLDANNRPTEWLERWPWPTRLPQYVRIELDPLSQIVWPPLVVAIRMNLPDGNYQVAP